MRNPSFVLKLFLSTFFTLFFSVFSVNSQNNKSASKKVYFKKVIVKKKSGQDARNLSNDEVKIKLMVGDILLDTYEDYGNGEYDEQEMSFYLISDISQKTYKIAKPDDRNIVVSYTIFFQGEERLSWEVTYTKNPQDKWIKSKCEGECN